MQKLRGVTLCKLRHTCFWNLFPPGCSERSDSPRKIHSAGLGLPSTLHIISFPFSLETNRVSTLWLSPVVHQQGLCVTSWDAATRMEQMNYSVFRKFLQRIPHSSCLCCNFLFEYGLSSPKFMLKFDSQWKYCEVVGMLRSD
jgi:hypothetical protein